MSVELLNKNLLMLYKNHQAGRGRKGTAVLEGSARSGKTWSVLEYFITSCYAMPGLVCTVFRKDSATHERAALRDFKLLMAGRYKALWINGHWNGQIKTFTFLNGSIIEFAGTNDVLKLQGPGRDYAFINEAIEVRAAAYNQIVKRTRCMVILDFNPSLNQHWIFKTVLKRDDVMYVHSTYKDNPHLSAKQVREIEASDPGNPENVRQGTANEWEWKVYGLGERCALAGAIYRDYTVVTEWPERVSFSVWGFGLDFGSVDPTALTECGLHQDKLWVRSWIYESDLITCMSREKPNTPSIQGRMREQEFSKEWPVLGDCAAKGDIKALVTEGYNVSACEKGAGSIKAGINLVKRFPLMVWHESQEIQLEAQQYCWRRHADGTWLDVPGDKHNHAFDSIRYFATAKLPNIVFDEKKKKKREEPEVWNPLKRKGLAR